MDLVGIKQLFAITVCATLCASAAPLAAQLQPAEAPVASGSSADEPSPASIASAPQVGSSVAAGSALSLVVEPGSSELDAEAVRAALERELAVPLVRVAQTDGMHVRVAASELSAVRVSFVPSEGPAIERTLDLSSSGLHANETLALVAANLMRDEAADLLARLRAQSSDAAASAAAQVSPPAVVPPPLPPPPPRPPLPRGCDPNGLRQVQFGFDVLPYVGMSTEQGTRVERKLSLNLFGGITGAVRGFELGGFLNLVDHSLCGLQISGAASFVNGPVQGVQIGMLNWANGRVDGAQFGLLAGTNGPLRGAQYGLVEIALGDVSGAQFGLLNVGIGALSGAQLGLANLSTLSVTGAQLGLANVSGDSLSGLQAGLANVSSRAVDGAQLGLANVSGAGARGLQLGLVNVASGRVRGAQIGLVNVAQDADAALGLVNVLWNGRTHLDVWGTDFGALMLGVEHGGRIMHNIYGFGLARNDGRAVLVPSYGLGARVISLPRLFVDIDALAYGLFRHDPRDTKWDYAVIGQLRVPVAIRITSAVAIFVSPAVSVSVTEVDDGNGNKLEDPPIYGSTVLTNDGASVRVRIWPGFTVGGRFF